MSIEMALPSEDLARRLTTPVAAADVLVGIMMHKTRGSVHSYLYSLPNVAAFLHIDSYEDLMEAKTNAHIGYIDPEALKRWVGGVFGDTELVAALDEAIAGAAAYAYMVEPMREVIETRISQCKQVLGIEEPASEEAVEAEAATAEAEEASEPQAEAVEAEAAPAQ